LEACVHAAVIPAEHCPNATAAPRIRYELGERFYGSEKLDPAVPCLEGKAHGPTAPSALAYAFDSVRVAPIAFNAIAYQECSPLNRMECWRSLEIQSWPECRRNATSYPNDPRDLALDGEEPYEVPGYRSLPALAFESGSRIELYGGSATVVIFAEDRMLAQRAALVLVRMYPSLRRVPASARASANDPGLTCKGRTRRGLAPALGSRRPREAVAPLQTAFTHNETATGICARSFVDPVNVLWYGQSASASRVGDELNDRGGWWMDDDAPLAPTTVDHQDAQAPSPDCSAESDQRSSSCPVCDRDHIRLFNLAWQGEHLVLGDAHHDRSVFFTKGCENWGLPLAHVSSTYITPREEIAGFWPAPRHLVYWGNTRRMPQCDGSAPHSDGYVLEESVSVPPTGTALEHAASSPETTVRPAEAFLLPPPARCAHASAVATLRLEECNLDATLRALHAAARDRNEAAVCQLMVPAAVAELSGQRERALRQYAAACAGRMYTPSLRRIAAGTAGQRTGRVQVTAGIAHATLLAPRGAPGGRATFIYIAGRWRLLFRTD
jgi:hypothetical protein